MDMAVTNYVREARMERNWTQDQLAEAVGCTRGTITALERGREPSAELMLLVARALEKPVEQLFEPSRTSLAQRVEQVARFVAGGMVTAVIFSCAIGAVFGWWASLDRTHNVPDGNVPAMMSRVFLSPGTVYTEIVAVNAAPDVRTQGKNAGGNEILRERCMHWLTQYGAWADASAPTDSLRSGLLQIHADCDDVLRDPDLAAAHRRAVVFADLETPAFAVNLGRLRRAHAEMLLLGADHSYSLGDATAARALMHEAFSIDPLTRAMLVARPPDHTQGYYYLPNLVLLYDRNDWQQGR